MNFRESYGLAPKPTWRCPVCGVETKPRKKCGYHAQQARPRDERTGRYYGLLGVLREAVDEARQ